MGSGIYSALSGALANERRVEMISHNVANVNTTGFQPFQMTFEAVKAAPSNNETVFAMPATMEVDTRPGPIEATGNPMDIALTEGVHIAVTDDTRAGFIHGATLMVQPGGALVTSEGLAVLGKEGPINVPSTARNVSIGAEGDVIADEAIVDKLRLVEFDNAKDLEAGPGRVVFDKGRAGERASTAVSPVLPGYVEHTTYGAVQGMSGLVIAHRSYDIQMKMIESFSQIEKRAARDISK